jgi:hypothetical protein
MQLADLCADVLKVERPGGDPMREFRPAAFGAVNRSKRSIVMDLKRLRAKAWYMLCRRPPMCCWRAIDLVWWIGSTSATVGYPASTPG